MYCWGGADVQRAGGRADKVLVVWLDLPNNLCFSLAFSPFLPPSLSECVCLPACLSASVSLVCIF